MAYNPAARHHRTHPLKHLGNDELNVIAELGKISRLLKPSMSAALERLVDLAMYEQAERDLRAELDSHSNTV